MTSKPTSTCTFCNKFPAMITCRDCQEAASCYGCTILLPTGGMCKQDFERFEKLHFDNHKQELVDS